MSDRPLTLPFLIGRTPAVPAAWPPATPYRDTPRQPKRPSVLALVRLAWRRYHSRVRLAQLDPYLLKDIGITPAEAEQEANRPFWRA